MALKQFDIVSLPSLKDASFHIVFLGYLGGIDFRWTPYLSTGVANSFETATSDEDKELIDRFIKRIQERREIVYERSLRYGFCVLTTRPEYALRFVQSVGKDVYGAESHDSVIASAVFGENPIPGSHIFDDQGNRNYALLDAVAYCRSAAGDEQPLFLADPAKLEAIVADRSFGRLAQQITLGELAGGREFGIQFTGLYVLAAPANVGKTEYMRQLIDKAKFGNLYELGERNNLWIDPATASIKIDHAASTGGFLDSLSAIRFILGEVASSTTQPGGIEGCFVTLMLAINAVARLNGTVLISSVNPGLTMKGVQKEVENLGRSFAQGVISFRSSRPLGNVWLYELTAELVPLRAPALISFRAKNLASAGADVSSQGHELNAHENNSEGNGAFPSLI